jgi:hypothetical protein
MSNTTHIKISDRGEDYEVYVVAYATGFICLETTDSSGAIAYPPRMTPEEARRLAQHMMDAADKLDE